MSIYYGLEAAMTMLSSTTHVKGGAIKRFTEVISCPGRTMLLRTLVNALTVKWLQTQCVNHGEEATPLTLPVLLGATQTGGIVEHSVGEGLSLSSYHVSQLIQGELGITRVLPDVDSASLQSTMSHLCIEGKEAELWVSGETTIIVLHQVLKVVADGDLDLTLAQEVPSPCWEEGGEGTREVALSGELIEGHSTNRGPHQSCI